VNVTSNAPTATNTVAFKPNGGVTATVSGASASSAIFKIINTSYITIDGSNSAGGTTRDLTLQNTSATSPMVVWFGSSGTTPITNGTLKNCVVQNGANTSSAVVISDGATAGNAGYFSTMEVRNNRIEKAFIAVYATGGTTPANGSGLTYVGNQLSTSGANAIAKVGLYMQGVNGGTVSNNDVGNFDTATAESDAGIWLATGTANVAVNANRVHDIRYTGTSGYGGRGIAVSTGTAPSGIVVSNNMVFNITGDGDSYSSYGCTYSPVGIYVFGSATGGVGVYDNSIYLYGNTINYSAAAYSIGIGLDDGATGNVSGNSVVNNLGRVGATGAGAVALALETGAAQLTGGDYNDLYCNSTGGGANLVGKIGASDYATMPAWRTASGRDANSISADPQYVGNTDLHVRLDVSSPLNNAGTTISGITTDYDGDLRMAVPDIGADETYTLVTGVVGSGSIQVVPAQVSYAPGSSVTLTAVPDDACHEFVEWSGDAGGSTNPLVIAMDANKNITATFTVKTYTIAASAGTGGAISPSGDVVVDCGADQEFTITADDCYDIADVVVDGVPQGPIGSYLFEDVAADHTIVASFTLKTFTIAASAGVGGSISPDGDVVVDCGADQEFTITAGDCYDIADVVVDGVPQGPVGSYLFEDVAADHTIVASFTLKTFTIAASAGVGGSITPSGDVVVDCGADQEFTITAGDCYDIADVVVDGVPQGPIGSYLFEGVDSDHTIVASFSIITYTLTTGVVGDGYLVTDPDQPSYDCGTEVQITAHANPGWQFDHWTGNATGSDNPLTLTMDGDKSVTAVFVDVAGPDVTVIAPNGGESWLVGSTHQITWTATDVSGVAGIDLAYSTDGGATYPNVIATGLANTGTYDWVIPNTPTVDAMVLVTAHDGVGNVSQDASDLVFTIEAVSPVEALFYATALPEQEVTLRWVFSGHLSGTGIRIYRALAAEGPYECITATPLPIVESGTYVDENAWPGGTFWYELRVVVASGDEVVASGARPSVTVPGVLSFGIRYVAPNPTAAGASIAYSLPVDSQSARLSIYDVSGRLIRSLDPRVDSRGGYGTVQWDGLGQSGERLVSGVYFVLLEVDGAVATQKVTLLR
jgi:hypothetical protein